MEKKKCWMYKHVLLQNYIEIQFECIHRNYYSALWRPSSNRAALAIIWILNLRLHVAHFLLSQPSTWCFPAAVYLDQMVFSAYWHRKKSSLKGFQSLYSWTGWQSAGAGQTDCTRGDRSCLPTALQTWRPNPPVIAPTCSSSLTSSNSLLCCLRAPFVLLHFILTIKHCPI